MVADPGPMARFEDVKSDGGAPAEIFRLLTEGRTLKDIAREWRLPKGAFVRWFTVEHAAEYDAALKAKADDLAHESLQIADAPTEDVPRDKLRVDTRLKLASKWDRARYGETVKVEHSSRLEVDAGLLGTIGELLGKAAQLREKQVVGEVVQPAIEAKAEQI